jgi:hypothetical protein
MNHDWHDLIQRYIADTLSDDEALALQNALKSDADLRALYLDYMSLDVALGSHAESRAAVNEILASPMAGETSRSARWLSWRPITAAAAGIVFGMFCTSVVYGLVVPRSLEKKTALRITEASFENPQLPLAKDFPPVPALWGGDEAEVVPAENGITPKHGHLMLRLVRTSNGAPLLFPRLYQVIALPPSTTELREIEVSASFASSDPASSPYYSIRAYAVTEAPERLGPDWFDHRDEAIASAATGFDSPLGKRGWQTFGLRIQVPSKARSLVVFFGVKTRDESQPKLPHYLDAVLVSLIESEPIP